MLPTPFKFKQDEQESGFFFSQKQRQEIINTITDNILDRMVNILPQLVPTPKNGKDGETPSDERLLRLIKKVIPNVRDGKDADEERIFKRLLERIPEVPAPVIQQIETRTIEKVVEDERVPVLLKAIEQIKKEVRRLSGGGRQSGGGMGTAITESFAVSSATTSLTLQNRVASNGRAMWLNYQGQQQAYGTHFTISGRTVTLLFTPDDGTFIDTIYIRA